ncbi:S-layer homology domain-containing protein [Paenibacillus sp. S150]|uniref:S-layer homology domain-containing protein n=1 Tax=Paenibacillus sp. S150 TaxID=2749826 RepID=UPI001C5619A5|nr:S-layer homology domain-containing protein [Paenibacillus sp. S150]MBW4084931.1 S-layer homology domain-containing protein [Paenibacillus sp. S150]
MNIPSRRKKWWAAALSFVLVAGMALPSAPTASAAPDNSIPVISQVYGGGGNTGATYKNDFIELYNPTAAAIDLTGWKVRYASSSGDFSDQLTTPLSGSIPAGGFYLIQEAAGSGGTAELPAPDLVAAGDAVLSMAGASGKVELADASGTRVDLVGYGTASAYEGTGAVPALSNTTAAVRKTSALLPSGNRGLDTDQNNADFTVQAPEPRSSVTDSATAPAVSASIPSGTTVPKGTELALGTGSVTASVYYSVYANGSTTALEDYALYITPILLQDDTVLIKAYSAEEGKRDNGIFQFSYTTQAAAEGLTIPQIQGTAHSSIYADQLVKGVAGIVTYTSGSTFYMQTATPDSDVRTSEAIMVYLPGNQVKAGDSIVVDGRVKEYKEAGYSDANDLLTTEIVATRADVLSSGNALPAATIIGTGGRVIPATTISAGLSAALEPDKYALDFYESLEGMRLQLNAPKIIGPYDYEIPVAVDNGSSATEVFSPAGGLVLTGADFNPQRILIDAEPSTPVRTGQLFKGNIIGVLSYDYGNFKIRPESALPEVDAGTSIERETTDLAPGGDQLTVASFNVENFSRNSSQDKISNIAKAIVTNLKTPDIIGLLEVQDNDGESNSGTVDAAESYIALIEAIKKAGGPTYAYTDIAPDNNRDGGVPGGNIRAGFIYNVARVELAPGTKGDAATPVVYSADGGLSLNPGRIDPLNPAFDDSRKPLAAEFIFNNEKVMVIANHFNSKTGDSTLYGGVQPPVRSSEAQRVQIAAVVSGFVSDVLAKDPDANVVVLGDLNDFQFSDTLKILKGSALTNLIDTLPLGERYSYIYEGNSQTLDHLLVNNKLAAKSTLDIVHINADFDAKEGRVSDHDPLLAQIDLGTENFSLRVLHTNDTHGHLENISRRTSAISSERTGNTVLLDAGDVFSGTLYFTQFKGQADISFMNNIGYDAMTFGNHEFDLNKEQPEVLKNFVTAAKFPFTSANIDFTTKASELAELYQDITGTLETDETRSTAKDGHIYPSVIKDVYGEKIGIFGLTTEDTAGLSSPGDQISFKDHVESAKNTVAMLEAQGINKIIAVTHLGYTVDQELAKAVPGIDIIVGGHSHTKVDQPPTPVVNVGTGKNVLIVQTGEYSQFLGELDVTFDKNGEILSYNGKLLDVSLFGEDAAAKAMLAPYDAELTTVRSTVVGYSDVDLYTNRMIDGKSVRVVRQEETPIGNMIADSIAEKVSELMPSFVSAGDLETIKGVVAIQNGGGIRAAIDKGDITMGEVLTTLPFGNSLVALKVTGEEIISSLENSVSGLSSDQGRFAQASGMKYTYDSTKTPEIVDSLTGEVTQAGERIVAVEIRQTDGSYLPVDPDAYYLLATNSFMAGGGDFYRALADAKADGRYYELGLPDFEVLLSYLDKHNPVTIGVEGRITDLKGEAPLPTPTPTPTSPPGGGGAPSTPTPTPTPSPTAAPTASPQITTITAEDLTSRLAALPAGTSELLIPLTASSGGAQVVLPGSVLVQQAASNPAAVLTFTTPDGASYSLPLSVLNGTALAAQLGTGDFTITVSLLPADAATLSGISQAITAQGGSLSLAAPVMEFTVTAQAGNSSVPLNSFGGTYVKRTITAPSALDSQSATAVSFDPATGKLSFVPSVFAGKSDGTTEVTIKRNSNSYYTVVESSKTFGDITGHWAKSSIDLLASKLIITGTSATAFQPSQMVTRAEFAALITRSLGLASMSSAAAFNDVGANAWYTDAVQTAAAAGLLTGYTDGSFKPDSPITRQEMATILSKAMKYTGKSLNAEPAVLAKFSDASAIPAWSQAAVAEIAAEGIIQGRPDGSFAPQVLATRAEAATMLEKTLKSLEFIN